MVKKRRLTWAALLLSLALALALQVYLIGVELPIFLDHSNGMRNPDQLILYSVNDLAVLFQTLGVEGREHYRRMLAIDLIYMNANFVWIFIALSMLPLVKRFPVLKVLPLLGLASDAIENSCLYFLLVVWPDMNSGIATSSAAATISKFVVLVGVALIFWVSAYQWVRRHWFSR